MANRIALTVNGNTNIKLRPRNMSRHLLVHLVNEKHVNKMMRVQDVQYYGEMDFLAQEQEEVRVKLTQTQYAEVVDEYLRRMHA